LSTGIRFPRLPKCYMRSCRYSFGEIDLVIVKLHISIRKTHPYAHCVRIDTVEVLVIDYIMADAALTSRPNAMLTILASNGYCHCLPNLKDDGAIVWLLHDVYRGWSEHFALRADAQILEYPEFLHLAPFLLAYPYRFRLYCFPLFQSS